MYFLLLHNIFSPNRDNETNFKTKLILRIVFSIVHLGLTGMQLLQNKQNEIKIEQVTEERWNKKQDNHETQKRWTKKQESKNHRNDELRNKRARTTGTMELRTTEHENKE
jgi:hypothetical protein